MQNDQGHHPDYNFIMNPGGPQRAGLLKSADKKQRLLMIVIGGGLVMIVLVMILSSLFTGSSTNTDRLIGLVKQQTELVRVASLAEEDASSAATKNFASTVQFSLTSAKSDTSKLVVTQGGKIDPKVIATGQNKETTDALTAAKQANRYDETFTVALKAELADYQAELSDFFKDTGATAEKTLLQKLYNNAQLLTEATP